MMSELSLQPAGLFRRVAALAYDLLCLTAVYVLATFLMLPFSGGEAIHEGNPLYRTALFLLTFFYFAWQWIHGGQTLGMLAWKIRILRRDEDLPIGWWHALLRFLLALPSLAFFGIGLIWCVFAKNGQSWHDNLAETRVVLFDRKKMAAESP